MTHIFKQDIEECEYEWSVAKRKEPVRDEGGKVGRDQAIHNKLIDLMSWESGAVRAHLGHYVQSPVTNSNGNDHLYAEHTCEMLGWMKHKLESRLPGEISVTLDTTITPP